MQNRLSAKILFIILSLCLCIVSCEELKPKGDEFTWSPDGRRLAVITLGSRELFVVDIENDHIGTITQIDTYQEEKETRIFAPAWSYDGQFLLYSKRTKKSVDIFVYSLKDSSRIRIDTFILDSEDDFKRRAFPSWSPEENRILYTSWDDEHQNRLYSAAPDGKDKKLLIKAGCEQIFPSWSPDGRWIAYSIFYKDGNKNNGLWKMESNGSDPKQIYKANRITQFQWAPDGAHIGIVKVKKKKENKIYDFFIIDSAGDNEQLISREKFEIIEPDWSPDGQSISFVEKTESYKNIWLIDVTSLKKVKLTFDNVEDYFGWGNSGKLFFTVKYPEEIVKMTDFEEERREFLDGIRGIVKENQLISIDNFKPVRLEDNVYCFQYCVKNNSTAYFKPSKSDLYSAFYFPVIKLSDGGIVYLARTQNEHTAAVNELYLNRKYQNALKQMNGYWNTNLESTNYKSGFDVDSILLNIKADGDSSHIKHLLRGLEDGSLLKTILIMRRLEQNEKASWMFDQFRKLTLHYFQDEKKRDDKYNNLFWSIIQTYGMYREFESGIRDLDTMLTWGEPDSLFITNLYLAQVVLAFEDNQDYSGLKKVNENLNYIIENFDELDDFQGHLFLLLFFSDSEHETMFFPLIEKLVNRYSERKDLYELFDLFGDRYQEIGKTEKAFDAYQVSVSQKFDNYEIWDKIFKLGSSQ